MTGMCRCSLHASITVEKTFIPEKVGCQLELPDDGRCSRARRVVGGSRQIPGAVLLAGIAALRAGAGKLQVATADDAALPLAIAMPEAKVIGLRSDRGGAIVQLGAEAAKVARNADAVVAGPGMDPTAATRRVVRSVIDAAQATLVLDAGALHIGAARAFKSRTRDGALVMTPHLGEMAAMLDTDADAIAAAPEAAARAFAKDWGVVLALKGAKTCIASPDGRVWINTAGSPGLGTSGSGDVLAGIIAGLAARGSSAEQAAVWGVHLHAQAGALLSKRLGLVGFLAREISGEVPALLQLR